MDFIQKSEEGEVGAIALQEGVGRTHMRALVENSLSHNVLVTYDRVFKLEIYLYNKPFTRICIIFFLWLKTELLRWLKDCGTFTSLLINYLVIAYNRWMERIQLQLIRSMMQKRVTKDPPILLRLQYGH